MKKSILMLLLLFIQSTGFTQTSPDERKIFYHVHQATRWAELMHTRNCIFSISEIKKHLGQIKYTEPRLVDSKFYGDYKYLSKVAFAALKSDITDIESFREKIHTKAEKLNLEHPKNWQSEFLACSKRLNDVGQNRK